MTNRFRVWDGDEMHEPPHRYLLGAEGTVHRCSYQCDMAERAVEGKPLFYTGLDDTEGTLIYEGDVLEYDLIGGRSETVVVAYSESAGQWEVNFTGIGVRDDSLAWRRASDDVLVIGNRYENPDLLERAET